MLSKKDRKGEEGVGKVGKRSNIQKRCKTCNLDEIMKEGRREKIELARKEENKVRKVCFRKDGSIRMELKSCSFLKEETVDQH